MGKNVGLEELREALSDNKLWIALGIVKKVAVLSDRSAMRVQVSILPEEREVIATMTWESTGPESGIFELPVANDLVLVAFADGDPDQAFVIRRLTSKEDKMPLKAQDGHLVLQAKSGKDTFVVGRKIYIAKKDSTPTEPLVLGNVLKTLLEALIDDVLNAPQIGQCAVGPVFLDPSIRSNWQSRKQTYLTTTASNILSQLGFTERGP